MSDPRPHPNFQRFAEELKDEIAWINMVHAKDTTGQARTDIKALVKLREHVRQVSWSLGYGR